MKKLIEKYSTKPIGLFKTLFITFFAGYIPFALIHIALNLSGVIPVNFNDKPIYGFQGALFILLYTPLVALLFTITIWIYFMIGNLFLRLLKKLFL
ncbi:hypothetical protein [Flavobacterium sp. NRK1]|uniref:hypothetical protein n=1 Tax=Flavobacterium sp. NRK1 TaxID=2954929 RepID=UPI00209211F7|nr:hypothetical protein [Flavobacterium sp. NRK1]MCO6147494.1 hypothetical protein [Flavobacterium sp. NRK1]